MGGMRQGRQTDKTGRTDMCVANELMGNNGMAWQAGSRTRGWIWTDMSACTGRWEDEVGQDGQ